MTDQQILTPNAAPDTGRVRPLWGRCDGTPGNPGIETIPSEDGPEKYACTGCPACRVDGVRARIARTGDVLLGAGGPARPRDGRQRVTGLERDGLSGDPDEVW